MNAFTRFLGMTRKPKRRKNRAKKPRLGGVTTKHDGDLTIYRAKVNPPKPRKLVVNSLRRKK